MSEAKVGFTPEQESLINGLLLGDGSITLNKSGTGYLTVTRSSVDLVYARWCAKRLDNLLIQSSASDRIGPYPVLDKRTKKTYWQVRIRSKCLPVFSDLKRKWYPNGKKVVPDDLVLTPLTVGVWLADDGSISVGKGKKGTATQGREYPHRLDVKFATHGFSVEDADRLAELLSATFNVTVKRYLEKGKVQPTLRLCKSSEAKKLLRAIDPFFPEGMERKSDRWRGPQADILNVGKVHPSCPYCPFITRVHKNGKATAGYKTKYICLECRKQFLKESDYGRLR